MPAWSQRMGLMMRLTWCGCEQPWVLGPIIELDGGADPIVPGADSGTRAPLDAVGDVFGSVRLFDQGRALGAGRHRVRLRDGCMKHNQVYGWSVHAYADGAGAWWMIGATSVDRRFRLPGITGFRPGDGGYAAFEDCVAAAVASPALDVTHGGGALGVWLDDEPYEDNLPGLGGRSPSWSLEQVELEPP